jgi:hypothetical protein
MVHAKPDPPCPPRGREGLLPRCALRELHLDNVSAAENSRDETGRGFQVCFVTSRPVLSGGSPVAWRRPRLGPAACSSPPSAGCSSPRSLSACAPLSWSAAGAVQRPLALPLRRLLRHMLAPPPPPLTSLRRAPGTTRWAALPRLGPRCAPCRRPLDMHNSKRHGRSLRRGLQGCSGPGKCKGQPASPCSSAGLGAPLRRRWRKGCAEGTNTRAEMHARQGSHASPRMRPHGRAERGRERGAREKHAAPHAPPTARYLGRPALSSCMNCS